jgi:DNA-binding NarL/FixJ family response regulator
VNADERHALRQAVSDRRRVQVAEAHGKARGVGLKRESDPTECELKVLRRLAEGRGIRDAAADLSLAYDTVRSHTLSLRKKLDARNTTHACVIAVRLGWIE